MSHDRRSALRTALSARVRISHPTLGERVYHTRDISDSGIFVVVEDDTWPDIGDQVEVQVQGLPGEAPVLGMKVVRLTPEGFGLEFLNL
ncbi:PilZ domain-containing protein [Marinobacter bohaiensis]|uniref:PilZ domain-containing protein n=1 Tax=Marinobacter bohaiensis TaxID=2201898 RepID=UPI000DAF0ACE|nr:PilZ domain-containing protein [Marinobacter bohaiensis]